MPRSGWPATTEGVRECRDGPRTTPPRRTSPLRYLAPQVCPQALRNDLAGHLHVHARRLRRCDLGDALPPHVPQPEVTALPVVDQQVAVRYPCLRPDVAAAASLVPFGPQGRFLLFLSLKDSAECGTTGRGTRRCSRRGASARAFDVGIWPPAVFAFGDFEDSRRFAVARQSEDCGGAVLLADEYR